MSPRSGGTQTGPEGAAEIEPISDPADTSFKNKESEMDTRVNMCNQSLKAEKFSPNFSKQKPLKNHKTKPLFFSSLKMFTLA